MPVKAEVVSLFLDQPLYYDISQTDDIKKNCSDIEYCMFAIKKLGRVVRGLLFNVETEQST